MHFPTAQIWRGCLRSGNFGCCPASATLHPQGQQTSFVHPLLQFLDSHRRWLEEGKILRMVLLAAGYHRGPHMILKGSSRGPAGVMADGRQESGGRSSPVAARAPAVHPTSTWLGLVPVPVRTAPDATVARPPLEQRRPPAHAEVLETSATGQLHPRTGRPSHSQLRRRRPGRGHLLRRAVAASGAAGWTHGCAAGERRPLALSPGSRGSAPPRARVRGQVVHGLDQQIIGLSQLGLQPARLQAAALHPRGGARRSGRRGPQRLRPLGRAARGQVLVVVGALVLPVVAAAPGAWRGASKRAAHSGGLPRPARPWDPRARLLGPPRGPLHAGARELVERRASLGERGRRGVRLQPERPGSVPLSEPAERPPQGLHHARRPQQPGSPGARGGLRVPRGRRRWRLSVTAAGPRQLLTYLA